MTLIYFKTTMEHPAVICYLAKVIIISLNSQELRFRCRKTAFAYFSRRRLDIILLQEIHWTVDMKMQIQREWIIYF